MCKLCEERIARNSGAATGAAMGATATNIGAVSTVDQETARMKAFADNGAVTERPEIFLGAPTPDGRGYGIGYKDNRGVNRVFFIDIANAEDMAQGMLQEIAHVKTRGSRKRLIDALQKGTARLMSGHDHQDVANEVQHAIDGVAA